VKALAPLVFSSFLFAALFGRRGRAALPPASPWGPPAPSNMPPPVTDGDEFYPPGSVPTVPSVPTEPPQPRATPKTVRVLALHRYEVVADLLPVDGVGLQSAAAKILDALRLDDSDLQSHKTVERAGVGKVTRVTFRVSSLINNEFPLDRQISTAGVGSVWVVSIKDITQ
jgi:hypothetical protein